MDWWNLNSSLVVLVLIAAFFIGVYIMEWIKKKKKKQRKEEDKDASQLFTESLLYDTTANITDTMLRQVELIEQELETVKAKSLEMKAAENELEKDYSTKKTELIAEKNLLANRYMQLKTSLEVMNRLTANYKQIEKNLGGK